MKTLLFALAGTLVLLSPPALAPASDLKPVNAADNLSPAQLEKAAKVKGAQLIDVRTPEEYAQGRIKGFQLRPLYELGTWAGTLDKKKPVILVCRSGNRTTVAWNELKRRGFKSVRHLDGGIKRWTAEGKPLER